MIAKKLIQGLIVTVCVFSFSAHALNPDGFESFVHLGHVYAQTVVTTEDGKPLWAEFNAQGGHSRLHQLDGLDGQVLPAMQVQSFFKLLNDFNNQYPDGIDVFTGPMMGTELLTATGEPIQWPSLPASSATVVFPSQSQRFTTNGEELNKLVLPIDITSLTESQLQGQLTTFFNEQGQFILSSPERIGRMTAFYLKDGAQAPADAAEYQPASGLINLSASNYQLLNPIPGVPIEAISGYVDGFGVTDDSGFYRLQGRLSPCPGFSYFPDVHAIAKLNYASFNPRSQGRLPYYITKTSYNTCNGYGAFPPGFNLTALMVQQEVRTMVIMQPENITRLNYPVAIQVLNGSLMMPGVSITSTTQYSLDNSANAQYTMVQDDYDGDGEIDQTVRGHLDAQGNFQSSAEGDRYGVYFSGAPRTDGQPNLVRIIDILPNVNHQGLLSSLSVEDFQKTDLLVFRASTGQLITQRVGLSADEINTADQRAYFQMAIRGPEDTGSHGVFRAQTSGWQAGGSGNTASPSRAQDSLRPGEHVHIVAINRPTGYIGTATAELTPTNIGGDISVKLNSPIILSPPNLQIWASRRVQAHGLLSNSDEERYTISNEGAATTDDTLLEIHTQWLNQDGTPLPSGLKGYGYTGRLTKQIEHTHASNDVMDNRVTEFSIDPGRHLQVIRFDQQQPYHHYVQINGYPSSEQNDFSSGEHSGALAHRPSRYVPIKVPLYDEQGSVTDRLALLNTDLAQTRTPKYHWVYRPELSFSVVDIKVNDILLKEYNDDTAISQSVLDSTYPVITGQEDIVEVLFSLISSEYDRITPLEGEQHYIFALGENEIEVRIDKSDSTNEQQISFSNLDYLTHLRASDYLTLSLYLNQDSHNVLWNWAFTTLDVDLDEDNNNGTDLPDRSLLEEQIESITQHSGKRNFLNNGDVNNNDIPDFAEFEYTIVPEQTQTPQNGLLRTMSLAPTSSNSQAEHHFVPIVVEIPQHVDLTAQDTTLKFYYAGSDPEQVEIKKDQDDPSGNKKDYKPAPGNMRLWTKDANEKRNPKAYQASGRGGDYLVPEQAYNINALLATNALNLSEAEANNRTLVIYAEAIRATENRGAVLTSVLTYTHTSGTGKETQKEERSVNGLTNLEKPFQAVAALPQDTPLELADSVNLDTTPPTPQITLYSIGGVRLKLTYNLNSLTREDRARLDKITWTFNQAGKLCKDLNVYANNQTPDGKTQCEDLKSTTDGPVFTAEHTTQGDKNEDHTIYWEPTVWTTDLDATLTTKTHYKEGQDTMTGYFISQPITVDYPEITQTLAIKTRELGPKPAGQEYRGNDVKMLEQMLWQLGLSPDRKIYSTKDKKEDRAKIGVAATRLSADKRDVFYTGTTENNVGNMLSRFNYFSHSPIATKNALANPTFMDVQPFNTLTDIKRHWTHYLQAYQTYSTQASYKLGDITDDKALKNVTSIFDGTVAGIAKTYGLVHKKITAQYEEFEPSAIVQAIAAHETSSYHWGYGESNSQKYRVVVGGADEAGSKGFNQIQNKFSYGGKSQSRGNKNGCIEASAYDTDGNSLMNHYDPIENLQGIAIWLAKSNCGGSFYNAFFTNQYTGTYTSTTHPIRAFKIGSDVTALSGNTYTDAEYEHLMKGIGGYNQGLNAFVKTKSWPELLATETKSAGKGVGVCYAFKVVYGCDNNCNNCKSKGEYLPFEYRQYIWKGGTYDANLTDAEGRPDPKAGKDWCFAYGEEEWLDGKTFKDVKDAALDRNPDTNEIQTPQGRIDCITGVSL